ncbi:hypothetical protein [Flavobacterium acetivorans]|uniref:hypothetical protein n=1 Tax=Flavobacterium acetivorans TaxID=2893883 RepID=UPI001E493473|nr:hypothetical protein [Flavobacterium sp. F-29]UFH34695.1 hypothetical protein LNP19_11425 [Flavobacterium sp. F-29]
MKSKFLFILLIVFSFPIFSQQKKEVIKGDELIIETPENGKVENGIYSCNLFDWKITIPEGYKISDQKRTEELENKGYEASKNVVGNGIKINPHPTQLIGFEINKYNYFKSSFESLIGTKKLTLEEHKKFTEQLLTDTYSKIKELKFELTSTDLKIGKYSFYKMQIRLYNVKNDKLLLTQELYNSFINDHLFSVSINYTNEEVGMLLNYTFNKSLEK